MNSPQLAELTWSDDGYPCSVHWGDVYLCGPDAPAASRHTFLHSTQLEARWRALGPNDHFSMGEVGFGTGLNFLCAWQLWDQSAPAGARLHFISAEPAPFSAADLHRVLATWPELAPWSAALLAQYSTPAPGWQRYVLAGGRVTLTLLVGDALEMLKQMDASIDAWLLTTYAVTAGAESSPALYRQLAVLSNPGTTVAAVTDTVQLRYELDAAGFELEPQPGHLTGSILAGKARSLPERAWTPPWYASPTRTISGKRQALVIGAGLAGCNTAFALAQRGWQVTVIERHAGEAQEASGNPQGILYCKLSPHQTALSRFVQTSYTFSLRLLHQLLEQNGRDWSACGVLQLSDQPKETARLQALAGQGYPSSFLQGVDAEQASQIAGVTVAESGLYFPEGGWVHPPAFCRALLAHPGITLNRCREAISLDYRDGQWRATDAQGNSAGEAPVAVICSAGDSRRFIQTAHLPLKTIRGQVTHLPANARSQALRTVLCGEGYVSPARLGEHHVGASFRFDRSDTEPSEEENASNLALLASLSSELDAAVRSGHDVQPETLAARAALRCTSPDYLPLIGPVVDAEPFRQAYAVLAKDASKRPNAPAPWHPGLFLNTAHGSRGLISCPLSGELIAALLEREPLPLPRDLFQAVHPSRFLLRQLIRGN